MNSKDPLITERQPSPASPREIGGAEATRQKAVPKAFGVQVIPQGEDSGQTVARDEGEIKKKNQDANLPGHGTPRGIPVPIPPGKRQKATPKAFGVQVISRGTRIEQAETRTAQANTRTAQAEMRTEQANTRTKQAEARTKQANTRTEQAKTRSEQAKTRTVQANTRTQQAEARTKQANTRTEQAKTRTEQAENSEQAISASELSYRRLFEAAKDGILILDVDTGRISDVNPFLIKLLGYAHSEMVGKTVGELSPFKDIESNKVMLERLQKDGYVRYEDLPLETRDGRHIAVEFVSNVYQAGDKKVIQCDIRDITERQQAEIAAIRLAAIVEFSDDAIIGQDPSGIITSWNKGAEKIFGYTASEMVGTSIMNIIPADRQEEEQQILGKMRCGESMEHFETLRQTKAGRLIDVSVTASPIKDATRSRPGGIIGISIVARDISERKAAEEKIRQLNVELEQRVVERTAQLQTANDELQAFSYSVSHDLRAPLRHVMGFVDLLQKDLARGVSSGSPQSGTNSSTPQAGGPALSEKSLQHLTTISQSAKRMGDLIDDLLAFSRVGRAEMKKTDVNLDDLVREALGDFYEKQKVEIRKAEIGVPFLLSAVPPWSKGGIPQSGTDSSTPQGEPISALTEWIIHPLPVVRADRALLRLVLVNLISNTVKFTGLRPGEAYAPEGTRAEAKIEIGCLTEKQKAEIRKTETKTKAEINKAESRNQFLLSTFPISALEDTVVFIHDNGVGFDPRYADKLFGVFQRLHSQDEFEGTGIGLANVQRIIHRHGGRAWAEGVVDGGATFYFSIPKQNTKQKSTQ